MRVLFVDDESRVLDGLRRSLRRERRRWDMEFVGGGEQALERIQAAPFDLVVSDMRMPGADGCRVLTRVRELHPQATRVVLSGQTEHEAALRMVTVAHQFLAKPCEPDRVKRLLERTECLLELLPDARVRGLVGGIGCLATTPGLLAELGAALADGQAVDRLANLVHHDLAVCAKLLQIASSAFLGLPRPVGSVPEAIGALGTHLMAALVARLETDAVTPRLEPALEERLHEVRHDAELVARVARALADGAPWAADAYLGGLLHDVGVVVLAATRPADYAAVLARRARERAPLHALERELLGVDHAAVGGWLAGTWGLPVEVVRTVTHHAAPATTGSSPGWSPLLAVHVAHALVDERRADPLCSAGLDVGLLRAAGVAERLDAWRELVRREIDPFEADRYLPRSR